MSMLCLMAAGASAQGWLNNVVNRAKDKAKEKIEEKIEEKVDQAIDESMEALENKKNNKKNKQEQTQEAQPQQQEAVEESYEAQPEAATQTAKTQQRQPLQQKWNNYDFVSGDQIIFEDNSAGEQLGEFPSMWDAFKGAAEIVEIDGKKCINYQNARITPLFNNNQPYLTDVCTIEWDVYFIHEKVWEANEGTDLHGWAGQNVSLVTKDKITKDFDWGSERALKIHFESQADPDRNVMTADFAFYYEWWTPSGEHRDGKYDLHNVDLEAWHHIAISFNKRAYKVYFDNQRVANIPNAKAPKWVEWETNSDSQRSHFIKNVRMAKGAVPLYDRLASDGKIVTYAITFEVGKADIKPESTGEINRITKMMQDDPSLKFEVQGHCDNTGAAAANEKLSQQRAEAIVAALVANGIAKDRLTAVGKGSSVPIGDNSTDEGRAKNRRVEFVKK